MRELVSQGTGDQELPQCPFSFGHQEVEKTLEGMTKQEEADEQMELLRNAIGINTEGWVSKERYEEAIAQAAEMKAQAIGCAEDDFEREMTVRHWPFHDPTRKSRRLQVKAYSNLVS